MKHLRSILIGAGAGALVLILLLLSGVINVASSTGRSALADWLFGTMVRQSVTLRSAGITVPPLDDPTLIRRGAGHYELVCAACHGSPLKPPDSIADSLEPKPPRLAAQMGHWRPPARVFWTVQHGIRYSAMPAWPTQERDDEVWAMTAFLEVLPDLSPEEYAALTGATAGDCTACHTESLGNPDPAFPRLDIQSPEYLADALRVFRDDSRASGTMQTVARQLDDAAIRDLATFHGRRTRTEPGGAGVGGVIARIGIPERKVPACESCHGGEARTEYPRLAGQSADYITQQLHLFQKLGADRGGRFAHVMAEAVRKITEEEIRAVAEWYGAR